MRAINTFLGSMAWTGFFPFAPATFTTALLALGIWFWAPSPLILLVLLAVGLVISVPVSTAMEQRFGKDPSACTIDEYVGFLIAIQGRHLVAPEISSFDLQVLNTSALGSWKILLAAFFLFRFFDIAKIWPGNRFESFPRGWGIVADDAMAGVYSFIALYLLCLTTWLG